MPNKLMVIDSRVTDLIPLLADRLHATIVVQTFLPSEPVESFSELDKAIKTYFKSTMNQLDAVTIISYYCSSHKESTSELTLNVIRDYLVSNYYIEPNKINAFISSTDLLEPYVFHTNG